MYGREDVSPLRRRFRWSLRPVLPLAALTAIGWWTALPATAPAEPSPVVCADRAGDAVDAPSTTDPSGAPLEDCPSTSERSTAERTELEWRALRRRAAARRREVMTQDRQAQAGARERRVRVEAVRGRTREVGQGTRRAPEPAGTVPAPGLVESGARDVEAVLAGFRTPMFLLPLFRAAERSSGVPWQVLAAINMIETDYGRNSAVSPAGAVGWMQFMPATWRDFGVDADGDGRRNPWDRADAIFAAAAYLRASGADQDLRGAIYAYNHADWYVEEVLAEAQRLAAVPDAVIATLENLANARPPVPSASRSRLVDRRTSAVDLIASPGSLVVAAADARVVSLGRSRERGGFVTLRDASGNRYRYEGLGRLATSDTDVGTAPRWADNRSGRKERLFAQPLRQRAWRNGGSVQLMTAGSDAAPLRLRVGRTVAAGSPLGVTPVSDDGLTRLRFSVRLPGRGMPWIDPRRLLDGWRRSELDGDRRAIARAGAGGGTTAGLAPDGLARRVLADRRISIYGCGRDDVARGLVDRRVLTLLAAMADEGLSPTVSSLECGHSHLTASGNVSEHSVGAAVDIAAVNGVPIAGHQERGGITERTVRWILRRTERPHQVISLLALGGASFAMPDHGDHIHVGFRPGPFVSSSGSVVASPAEWSAVLARVLPLAPDRRPG